MSNVSAFPNSLLVSAALPADAKFIHPTMSAMNAMPMTIRYKGMICGIQGTPTDEVTYYHLPTSNLANWQPFTLGGGEQNATEVPMGESITVSNPIGGFAIGDIVPATMDVHEVLRIMLSPTMSPTYIPPTLTLGGTLPLYREAGELITTTLTPTWLQNHAGNLTQYRLTRNGTLLHSTTSASTFTDTNFRLLVDTTYSAQVDHLDGPILNDSNGNPYPAGQITAGTITSNPIEYLAQRRAFFGPIDTLPITSISIRSLVNNPLNPAIGDDFQTSITPGRYGACWAYPATLPRATSITVGGINIIDAFVPAATPDPSIYGNAIEYTVSVEGADELGLTPIDYRVFAIIGDLPGINDTPYTLTI